MRRAKYSTQFKKDIKQAQKRGKDMAKLSAAMQLLTNRQILPAILKDHPLKGEWKPHRDLHIEPDWLLIYYLPDDDTVHFERTGTHSDLFK